MELKSAEFEEAVKLKSAYFASNRSKEAFGRLMESAKHNYWSKRWLADIYYQEKEPFDFLNLFFLDEEDLAYKLYSELASKNKRDLYCNFREHEYQLLRFLKPLADYVPSSSGESARPSFYFEITTISFACLLALSNDPEALVGLRYLEEKLKQMEVLPVDFVFVRELKTKTLALLAIAKNDMQLWEKAIGGDTTVLRVKSIFEDFGDGMLGKLMKTPLMQRFPITVEMVRALIDSYYPARSLITFFDLSVKEEQCYTTYPQYEPKTAEPIEPLYSVMMKY